MSAGDPSRMGQRSPSRCAGRQQMCAPGAQRNCCAPRYVTAGLLEAVDSVDHAGHRHDVSGGLDELHRRGPVQHEFVAVAVDDRCQVAVRAYDEQAAGVWIGPGALTDTVPLTL